MTSYPPVDIMVILKAQGEHRKKTGSLLLKLKLKVYDLRVFTGHTTQCMAQLVIFLLKVPDTFFNATHQLQ